MLFRSGNDGPTHHGVFDIGYLSPIPGMTLAAPKDGNELRAMLHHTVDHPLSGPVAIRYPRAAVPTEMRAEIDPIAWGTWEYITPLNEIVVLAVGTMVHETQMAISKMTEAAGRVCVVNARFVRPWDEAMLAEVAEHAKIIVTMEEGQLRGGFGESIGAWLLSRGWDGQFKMIGLPDRFVTHGSQPELYKEVGLDAGSIAAVLDSLARGLHGGGLLRRLGLRRNGKNGHSRRKGEEALSAAVDDTK